ncbi:TRAP transporter substrate-binding protein [Pseudodonghicola flavimaris]|uniref:TRAP transporter substrate-binding protein n=1 Tax=Pseudodonghicola flavimaris TaxID=3050036 RepID=A0ABT7F2H0_9RHOB|nr:TRAP transporter substrate-binding protein [Pseudodonghicola flavimaris]MDK3018644.1 TRAP transporter substrate-binding protein [Pseudodonghicola flavimaris]
MKVIRKTKTLLAAAALIASAGAATAETSWTMASGYADSNFMTQNIRKFIEDVQSSSGGALTISLHSNGTLMKLDAIRRAVQTDQVQIGEIRLGSYSNEDPMYNLAGLPFVAGDYDSAWKLMQAQKPYFDTLFDKIGLKVLAYQPWPGQGFYTKFPVTGLADFKGQKLRIYSKATQDMGNSLGFEATILPFAEIPQAFATGLIDALFTSPQTGIDIQAWDNTDYFTAAGAMYTKNAIVVNKDAFEALPEEVKAALVAAGETATKRGWDMSKETYAKQLGILRENGMTVADAPEEVIAKLKEIGLTMMADWQASASPEAIAVLDAYKAGL